MRTMGGALKACRSGTQLPVPDLDFDPDLEPVQETYEGPASEKTVEIPADSMPPSRRRSETMVVLESAIPCKLQTIDLEPVQVGDLVLLGNGVPQEYRSSPAIVTKVHE